MLTVDWCAQCSHFLWKNKINFFYTIVKLSIWIKMMTTIHLCVCVCVCVCVCAHSLLSISILVALISFLYFYSKLPFFFPMGPFKKKLLRSTQYLLGPTQRFKLFYKLEKYFRYSQNATLLIGLIMRFNSWNLFNVGRLFVPCKVTLRSMADKNTTATF